MAWERFYTAKSLEDTGKTVDEVEWSRRPDLTFYFLDAKGDKVQIDPEDGSFSPMWVPMSTCRFLLNSSRVANSRACNAKFKVGDRVAYYGSEKSIYRLRGKVSDVSQLLGETFVTVDLDNGEEWGAPEKDWTLAKSVRSRNAVVAKALNACGTARNAGGDDKTRFFAELDKIKAKLASGFGDIEDLLYEAVHGEYDGYGVATVRARTYHDMADKLWSSLSRR